MVNIVPKKLKSKTIKAILKHAEDGYPEEICGVVVVNGKTETYVKCENIAGDKTTGFKISPQSFADADDLGEIVGIVHSHPDGTTRPSSHDIAVMSSNREIELGIDPDSEPTPWHIVSWPEGDYTQWIPEVRNEILGRPFVHGLWDCWSTCRDYYKTYHGITFEDFQRDELWWENKDSVSLYEHHYKSSGFYQVESPEPGDMIVMQIGRSYHPNHAGIYLGHTNAFESRNLHGGPFMLHHMYGKNAEIVVYGGQWAQRARLILRHKEI
jgi:proteasome lid subunit RPN8/RPN11